MSDATDTQPDETQALPGDGLREGVVDALRDDLGDRLLDVHLVPQQDLWVRVSPDAWSFTAQALKSQGFDYFCFLSAIDWLPSPYGKGEDDPDAEPAEPDNEIKHGYTGGESRFQIFARVTDIRRHVSVTIKSDVPESMTMATWIPSYAGANWHERETHEMFGIGFDGHPDLRNLYLPGAFEGFPLRKDFPLLSRMVKPWPGIVDVEPMPEFDEPEATPTADTAAGDAVEAATESETEATETVTADESATATTVDVPETGAESPQPVDDDIQDAEVAVDAAQHASPAEPADGEPADGPVADTIITDDDEPADDDGATPEVAPVEPDTGPGTATMSTDADPEAPTPGEGIDPTNDVEDRDEEQPS